MSLDSDPDPKFGAYYPALFINALIGSYQINISSAMLGVVNSNFDSLNFYADSSTGTGTFSANPILGFFTASCGRQASMTSKASLSPLMFSTRKRCRI